MKCGFERNFGGAGLMPIRKDFSILTDDFWVVAALPLGGVLEGWSFGGVEGWSVGEMEWWSVGVLED